MPSGVSEIHLQLFSNSDFYTRNARKKESLNCEDTLPIGNHNYIRITIRLIFSTSSEAAASPLKSDSLPYSCGSFSAFLGAPHNCSFVICHNAQRTQENGRGKNNTLLIFYSTSIDFYELSVCL